MSPSDSFGLENVEESRSDVIRNAVKEIVFGSLAGMVSEIIEYPFDLAKVRLQAQLLSPLGNEADKPALRFRGPMDCLMQTWKDEGVKGLYRGMSAPMAGAMVETATLFVAYAGFQSLVREFSSRTKGSSAPLSLPQLGLAAGGAGAVASFVLTPIELIKCKMQVQMMNFPLSHPQAASSIPGRIPHRTLPPSPFLSTTKSRPSQSHCHSSTSHSNTSSRSIHDMACKTKAHALPAPHAHALHPPGALMLIRSIVEAHGVRGLWLGHTGTLLRETGGSAAWFVVKEYMTRVLVERRMSSLSSSSSSPHTSSRADAVPLPLPWESALSGAVAGAVGALILYPADTVKSAVQTEEEMRLGRRPTGGAGTSGSVIGAAAKRSRDRVLKRGFWNTFTTMYRVHGVKGLYAGCGMTVARAIPSSGIIFVVYDGLNNWLAS